MKASLVLLFCVLWVLDTYCATQFASVHDEANPLMRAIMVQYGIEAFVAVKLVVLSLYLSVAAFIRTWLHFLLCAIMIPIVYMGVVVANLV